MATKRVYTPEQKARRALYMRAWTEKNKARLKVVYLDAYRKRKSAGVVRVQSRARLYNLTDAKYQSMVESQGGKCAACECPHDPSKKLGELHVDHDHVTGRIRGLLCRRCNSALGYLGDDPIEAADRMRRYAEKVSPERTSLRWLSQ